MLKLFDSTDPETLFIEALRFQKIKYPDYSGIIYITPSPLRVRFAERKFHRVVNQENKNNLSYIPPDFTTLQELSKRFYLNYGTKSLIPWTMTPVLISLLSDKGMGLSVFMADLLKDLKQFHPGQDMEELKELTAMVMEKCNLPDTLKRSITECFEILVSYEELLNKNNLINEYDLPVICSDYIKKLANFKVAIIDNFYAPTKAEMMLLGTIIENSESALISIPRLNNLPEITDDYIAYLKERFDLVRAEVSSHPHLCSSALITSKGYRSDLKYHAYEDMESEVEGIARSIKSRFISGMIKDLSEVVVAFPKLNKYKDIVERVFYRYGIPFEIACKKSLAQTRPFIDLLCLIQSVNEDYPRMKFSQSLSSRYFSRIPKSLKKWIPTLSLSSGIVSGKKAWLDFFSRGNEIYNLNISQSTESGNLFDESGSSLISGFKEIKKDILEIFRKLEQIEKIKTSASLSEFATKLKVLLEELGFLDVAPTDEDYRAFAEMKTHFWNCLNELSSLESLKSVTLGLQEFSEYLWHILKHIYIEKKVEGVTVTDIPGAMSVTFLRHIYIGGLTDDDMPDRGNRDYILPDSVKKGITLPDLDRIIMLQKFLFENIIRSSEEIHLSYPLSEGEDKFLPSPFLYSGSLEEERTQGIFSKEELFVIKAEKGLSEYLTEIKVSLPPNILRGMLNVTDIDAYRSCPRRFFIEKILRVEPPSIKEYSIEADALGVIMHRVMEKIIFEPLDDMDNLKKKAKEMIDKIAGNKNIDKFWVGIIKDAFIEILPDIIAIEKEIRGDGYTPFMVEKNVTGEPLKGIKLKGKIDRIDKTDGAVAIVDYKTGSDTITCSKILNGKERLQLLLYAALLRTQGYKVNRVGIYSLKDLTIKWCPSKKRSRGGGEQPDMDDMITASLRYLEETVGELRKGNFKATPLDNNYFLCRRCHENPRCPYIQS